MEKERPKQLSDAPPPPSIRGTSRLLVCAKCGYPGGTFVNSPEGKIHQGGDCRRAAGLLDRLREALAKKFALPGSRRR